MSKSGLQGTGRSSRRRKKMSSSAAQLIYDCMAVCSEMEIKAMMKEYNVTSEEIDALRMESKNRGEKVAKEEKSIDVDINSGIETLEQMKGKGYVPDAQERATQVVTQEQYRNYYRRRFGSERAKAFEEAQALAKEKANRQAATVVERAWNRRKAVEAFYLRKIQFREKVKTMKEDHAIAVLQSAWRAVTCSKDLENKKAWKKINENATNKYKEELCKTLTKMYKNRRRENDFKSFVLVSVEATRGLPSTVLQPLVQLQVGGVVQRTAPCSTELWYGQPLQSDFVFPRGVGSETLRVTIMDKRSIVLDDGTTQSVTHTVGTRVLDVEGFEMGTTIDDWFPLNSGHGEVKLKITPLCDFYLHNPHGGEGLHEKTPGYHRNRFNEYQKRLKDDLKKLSNLSVDRSLYSEDEAAAIETQAGLSKVGSYSEGKQRVVLVSIIDGNVKDAQLDEPNSYAIASFGSGLNCCTQSAALGTVERQIKASCAIMGSTHPDWLSKRGHSSFVFQVPETGSENDDNWDGGSLGIPVFDDEISELNKQYPSFNRCTRLTITVANRTVPGIGWKTTEPHVREILGQADVAVYCGPHNLDHHCIHEVALHSSAHIHAKTGSPHAGSVRVCWSVVEPHRLAEVFHKCDASKLDEERQLLRASLLDRIDEALGLVLRSDLRTSKQKEEDKLDAFGYKAPFVEGENTLEPVTAFTFSAELHKEKLQKSFEKGFSLEEKNHPRDPFGSLSKGKKKLDVVNKIVKDQRNRLEPFLQHPSMIELKQRMWRALNELYYLEDGEMDSPDDAMVYLMSLNDEITCYHTLALQLSLRKSKIGRWLSNAETLLDNVRRKARELDQARVMAYPRLASLEHERGRLDASFSCYKREVYSTTLKKNVIVTQLRVKISNAMCAVAPVISLGLGGVFHPCIYIKVETPGQVGLTCGMRMKDEETGEPTCVPSSGWFDENGERKKSDLQVDDYDSRIDMMKLPGKHKGPWRDTFNWYLDRVDEKLANIRFSIWLWYPDRYVNAAEEGEEKKHYRICIGTADYSLSHLLNDVMASPTGKECFEGPQTLHLRMGLCGPEDALTVHCITNDLENLKIDFDSANRHLDRITDDSIKPLQSIAKQRIQIYGETSSLAQKKLTLKRKKLLLQQQHSRGFPVKASFEGEMHSEDDGTEPSILNAIGSFGNSVHSL